MGGVGRRLYNGGNYSVDRPIDAVSFVNAGSFAADTFDIFATRNTLTYTNFGTIQATYGMDFLTVDSKGLRQPSATILNGDRAVIEGLGTASLLFGYPEGHNYTFGDGVICLSTRRILLIVVASLFRFGVTFLPPASRWISPVPR